MTEIVKLSLSDKLPLTCTRQGTCCYGKRVSLNPWELACLARAKEMTAVEFRDEYCEFGGIRLKFDNEPNAGNQSACSQYHKEKGCLVHNGRPLVCRLFPLGRQKQGEESLYIYQGKEFPCLNECPGVLSLPKVMVSDYIEGQGAEMFQAAQDGYLEVMQNLAEAAFVLLLETGLAASGDKKTLSKWRSLGESDPRELSGWIGSEWIDRLMLPENSGDLLDPIPFIQSHNTALLETVQLKFSALETWEEISKASSLLTGMALLLGHGLGADCGSLAEHWIQTAKDNGSCG